MRRIDVLLSLSVLLSACGSSNTTGAGGSTAASGTTTGTTTGDGASSNSSASNGTSASSSGTTSATNTTSAASGSSSSGKPDAGPLPPDPCIDAGTCPLGTWINVTPSDMDPADLAPTQNAYGPGSAIVDPARPSDVYVGGSISGLWKSTDYGFTWKQIATTDDVPSAAHGVVIAVAGTTPATLWAAGYNEIHKSIDGGKTFTRTPLDISLYSLTVDPNDPNHLISGLHEADGVYESTDGGTTWKSVSGAGFPSGGVSWYPFFIDMGSAATTRTTWFAIAQNGASAIMTSDSGAHWHIPTGLDGLNHPHGNTQIFQTGSTLFVSGIGGPGQGVYRSTDLGASWTRVDSGQKPEAVVWGSKKSVYAMYSWACSNCDLGTNYESSPLPGTTWTDSTAPKELNLGPNSVAVTNDGTHSVFVAVMWSLGIWRYVEP